MKEEEEDVLGGGGVSDDELNREVFSFPRRR